MRHDTRQWTRRPSRRALMATAGGGLMATAGGGLLVAMALGPAIGAASAATGPVATTVLTTDVLPDLAQLAGGVAAPSTQSVRVGITLANPEAAAQDAAYHAIYTPGSPDYHHYLTSAEVAEQFGVPAATVSAVEAWATRDGLRVASAPNTGEYLLLTGSAAQAEQTFSVAMDDYTFNGTPFYANTDAPTVPADLDVSGVIGLNSLLASTTFNHPPAATATSNAVRHGAGPDQGTCVATECLGLTTPQDLWSIYDQPTSMAKKTADFGQGQQMAVLGEGAVSGVVSDLRDFEAEYGLPQVPVTIHSVGDDFSDTSGSGEWDIDMQSSTGMSPKALGETLYFAADLTDSSVLGDISAWGSDPKGPLQANASFGECEEDPTSAVTGGGVSAPGGFGGLAGTAGVEFTTASENALEQATLQGKTLFSSTGDTGSSCPVVAAAVIGAGNGVANQGFPETNYPASSPYVVAVGGTVLYSTPNTDTHPASDAQRSLETAWTFTGGGNTFYIPEPTYQDGIAASTTSPA